MIDMISLQDSNGLTVISLVSVSDYALGSAFASASTFVSALGPVPASVFLSVSQLPLALSIILSLPLFLP